MENFNELFEQANLVADHRTKVFNQLIEKTVNEILPKFCEACIKLDMSYVYMLTHSRIFAGNKKQFDEEGKEEFYLEIDLKECRISNANYNLFSGRFETDEQSTWIKFTDAEFKRTGILEFVKLLNSRLSDYIKKYSEKNKEAENLL
jgi:major membrane immunogen (membrane-anchored lipoprotein)